MSDKGIQQCIKCSQEFEMSKGESDYCSFECDPDMPHKHPPITREQVNDWCKREGMAIIPVDPPQHVIYAGFGQCFRLGTRLGISKAKYYYDALIKAAHDS